MRTDSIQAALSQREWFEDQKSVSTMHLSIRDHLVNAPAVADGPRHPKVGDQAAQYMRVLARQIAFFGRAARSCRGVRITHGASPMVVSGLERR
jgi:hypothetical protein